MSGPSTMAHLPDRTKKAIDVTDLDHTMMRALGIE